MRWEELRDDVADVWCLLDELLLHAEASGDEAVLGLLLEADTALLRVGRLTTARERRHHGRRPLTLDEVAEVLARLDGTLALARRARVPKAAPLLATARARLAQVAELVAAQQ